MGQMYRLSMAVSTQGEQERKVQPTYVRLPSELHRAVKERATAEDRTMAQTIRVALRHYLKTAADY